MGRVLDRDVSCQRAAWSHYTRRVNLVETLGVEIGVRQAGTPA